MAGSEQTTTTTAEEERPLPCFVRHPDAGGQCHEPSAVEVYRLSFCQRHGKEVRDVEERDEVYYFFERFSADHVPGVSSPVECAVEETVKQLHDGPSLDDVHHEALLRAFPNPPEDVREEIARWEADEELGHMPVVDCLLGSLHTLHKLMRIAREERQTWLTEILERHRESEAVRAAVALEHADRRQAEREGERAK